MTRLVQFSTLCILVLFITTAHSQIVDFIRSVDSVLAIPETCTSTSSNIRPINATAKIKARKDSTWFGDDDWYVTLQRKDGNQYDLGPNCFPAGPSKRSWVAGDVYQLQVKCTVLLYELQIGDILCFDLFIDLHHEDGALFEFLIPIPGYSSEKDVITAQQKKLRSAKRLNFLNRKKLNFLNLKGQIK